MPDYRATVPVLLCFDVYAWPEKNKKKLAAAIAETTRDLIEFNLGEVGEEDAAGFAVPTFVTDEGHRLNARLYPSDYAWCNTMAHLEPEPEAIVEDEKPVQKDRTGDPIAWVESFLERELEQREQGGMPRYIADAVDALEKFRALKALLQAKGAEQMDASPWKHIRDSDVIRGGASPQEKGGE